MWIENVAAIDVSVAQHHDAGENSMLIQIADPETPETEQRPATSPWFPTPRHRFKEVHRFEFLDVNDRDASAEKFGITDAQAAELVRLLQHAVDNQMNVVVHCMMGVCRSGAVREVGGLMGLQEITKTRNPNLRVKHKMLKALGMEYDPSKSPFQKSNPV